MDISDELNPQDWESIINDSESGVSTKTESSKVRSNKKLVLTIANLRLSIDRFNSESSKLYKIYLFLTFINVLAVIVNLIIILTR